MLPRHGDCIIVRCKWEKALREKWIKEEAKKVTDIDLTTKVVSEINSQKDNFPIWYAGDLILASLDEAVTTYAIVHLFSPVRSKDTVNNYNYQVRIKPDIAPCFSCQSAFQSYFSTQIRTVTRLCDSFTLQ